VSREGAESHTEKELLELIFMPGFSTASAITATSGRGVGMDVVRSNIKKVGGSVDVAIVAGKGTRVLLRIPQTLSIITCLMVRSGKRLIALPQQNITELLRIDPQQMTDLEGRDVYRLRGKLIPVLDLASLLAESGSRAQYLAVLKTENHVFALALDDILQPEEIVVKPLGPHLEDVTLFAGSAIIGDGEAITILDASGVARTADLAPNLVIDEKTETVGLKSTERYLLLDVSGQLMALKIEGVPRIERIKSSQLQTIQDTELMEYAGELIRIFRLETLLHIPRHEENESFVIVHKIGERLSAIPAMDVLNIIESPELTMTDLPNPVITGQFMHNGRIALTVDLSRLKRSGTDITKQWLSDTTMSAVA